MGDISSVWSQGSQITENSYGINPRAIFVEIEKANHRKSSANTENYVKTPNEKKSWREREREKFHYDNGDCKKGFFGMLGFVA